MRVILIKDADKIGKMGDTLTVKDGYGRNFLLPKKIAIEATPGAERVLEQKKQAHARREKRIKAECETLAAKIAELSCTISMEAGEEDKLFGSVTTEMISEVLANEGVEIDKRKIVLDEPIKAIGVYSVEVRLHPEVKAQARIWVVKK
jgi:large subunit ribosomal protein L9